MNPFAPRKGDPVVKREPLPPPPQPPAAPTATQKRKRPHAVAAAASSNHEAPLLESPPKRAKTAPSASSSAASVLTPAPTGKLAASVPARRPAHSAPPSTPTMDSPSFAQQCQSVHRFLDENVRRAMFFVSESSPMLQKRQGRDRAQQQEHKMSMEEVYAQIATHDFDMEQELLFFSGKPRQSPINPKLQFTARPCMQGNNCLAMVSAALHVVGENEDDENSLVLGSAVGAPPFVPTPLMQICTRQELDTMYRLGITPSEQRACLRCVRHALGSAVITKEAKSEPWPPSVILQWFGNKTDCPQGYNRRYCILPAKTGFNGLHMPLVAEFDDLLQIRWDPTTKGYFVDQSGLAAEQHPMEPDYPRQIWKRFAPGSSSSGASASASSSSKPPDFRAGAPRTGSTACCSDKPASRPSSARC